MRVFKRNWSKDYLENFHYRAGKTLLWETIKHASSLEEMLSS